MTEEEAAIIRKARAMKALLENGDFFELIVEGFIRDDIARIALNDDVENPRVQDELKARKILYHHIHDTIQQGETLLEQLQGE